VAVRKLKPAQSSPTFEKMNIERIKQCVEATQTAKRIVNASKKLTAQSQELLESVRRNKRRAS
jgi:ferritin-like metal-binding protein YciE